MENKKRLYIVSFGDSRKYRLPFEENSYDDNLHHSDRSPLNKVERELNAYLKAKFPDKMFSYFTTPKVEEVAWDERDKYESYPLLDETAMTDIKGVLVREVQDMQSTRELNSDAPFSDVSSNAV